MKYFILIILLVHGLIHLLGFVKEFNIAPIKQLSGDTLSTLSISAKKLVGIAWLLSTLLIAYAIILWGLSKNNWWIIGTIGLVLSQLLIILYWKDAKFGTVGNTILLLAIVYTYGQWQFANMVTKEISPIIAQNTKAKIVTQKDIEHLPKPVQDWMKASGVLGKEQTYNARLKQQGLLRASEKQGWMPVIARQYFDIVTPTFVWTVDAKMKSILIIGRDKYANGKGTMLIKPLGLITAVNAQGAKIDQGAMLRYLSELCWIPSAAIQKYLSWQQLDSNSAIVTMTYKGMTVSATFIFDELHRVKYIKAKRYMNEQDEQLTDWYIPISHWGSFEGIIIPTKGDVIWQLPDKDYNYYQWEITDIKYNISRAS